MDKAILFDMDGVLVDSEDVIRQAAVKGLAEYGIAAVEEDFIPFVGAGEDRYIGGVAEKYGHPYQKAMKDRVYQLYVELVDEQIKVFAGVHELLEILKAQGYQMAVASSADRIKVDANLRAAGIEQSLFGAILCGEDVQDKKPSPDIYLAACEALGQTPGNCIVVEDAINGIQAAQNAGMKCIAVSTSFSSQELARAGADRVVDQILEVAAAVQDI